MIIGRLFRPTLRMASSNGWYFASRMAIVLMASSFVEEDITIPQVTWIHQVHYVPHNAMSIALHQQNKETHFSPNEEVISKGDE